MAESRFRPGIVGSFLALVFTAAGVPSAFPASPPVADPEYRIRGYWEAPFDWGFAGIHSILLHGAGDSQSQVLVYNAGPLGAVWKVNPGDSLTASALLPVSTDNSNIFCGGHSVLKDGRALITGGNEYSDQGLDHVNIFDPTLQPPDYVSPRPRNMFEGRYYPTNTTLSNGTVLVTGGRKYQEFVSFGGVTTAGASNAVTVLGLRGTPVLVPGTPGGSPPASRSGHSASFDDFSNDQTRIGYRFRQRTIIFGGRDASGNLLNDVYALYRDELHAMSWEALTPAPDPVWGVPEPRMRHAAVIDLVDSSLVVYGGVNALGVVLGDVWKLHLYRGADGQWTRLQPTGADLTTSRWGAVAVYDSLEDRLLAYGGRSQAQVFGDLLALSLGPAPAWSHPAVEGMPPPAREAHLMLLDRKPGERNRLLIFGGLNLTGNPLGDLWELDLDTTPPTWSPLSATPDPLYGMPSPRGRAAAVYDPVYDRWMIYGGDTNGQLPGGQVGDVWELRFSFPTLPTDGHANELDASTSALAWKRYYDNLTGQGVAGHAAVFDTRWLNSSLPELFYPAFDFWQPLYSALKWMQLYPFMFLLPDGKVFYAGPEVKTMILDVNTGVWEDRFWTTTFLGGSAVQYRPGRIMKCGDYGVDGSTDTAVIDFTGDPESIGWRRTALTGSMTPRVEHNLTLLPTGQVLLSGGLSRRLDITSAERRPQLWDPVTEQYTSPDFLAPDPVNRDYHSTALLLPDGRILSTGGEIRSSPTDRSRFTATIYWPPYLFDDTGALATRPEITGMPPAVAYGSTFLVACPSAPEIASVCLIRPGAVTHAFNQEQRYVPLEFAPAGAGNWLEVTAPPDGNTAPPGYYLFFVVTADSVPSVATWVQMGATITGVPDAVRSVRLAAEPNPVSASTRISFGLPEAGRMRVEIFDLTGRKIRALAEGWRKGGLEDMLWDVRNDHGELVPNGVYFVRVTTGTTRNSLKLTVVR
jgi:hypothetical protein